MRHGSLREQERAYVLELLRLRRDQRWRSGVIQAARSLGALTQHEWEVLHGQIDALEPRLPAEDPPCDPLRCGCHPNGSERCTSVVFDSNLLCDYCARECDPADATALHGRCLLIPFSQRCERCRALSVRMGLWEAAKP